MQASKLQLSVIHLTGIYFFTKGFLLTRLVLSDQSHCSRPPIALADHGACWAPPRFRKAVVIVIDALRYDFTIPDPSSSASQHHYLNALPVLHETATQNPAHALLRPFIADPPTTTLQRLKALTTGTLPTFIDAGSNFAGTAIDEDNLIAQLRAAGRRVAHLGDDTWHALFPGLFEANLTRAYDSFNVWDLHTVDDGVAAHLFPLLARPEQWDVVVAHFLGLDHAGHRYGPDHPATAAKLRQMDALLRQTMHAVDDDTLLVVLGDHGMDAKGDHGGESFDEVAAALWMYSQRPFFGRLAPEHAQPPRTAHERPVAQIDLVPTLALLLGLPIPFNNLGAPIPEAFVGPEGKGWADLAGANALAAAQIERYRAAYAAKRGLGDEAFAGPRRLWEKAASLWSAGAPKVVGKQGFYEEAAAAFAEFAEEHLRVCRSLWARFDVPSMIVGIAVLALGVVVLVSWVSLDDGARECAVPVVLRYAGYSLAIGSIVLGIGLRYLGRLAIDIAALILAAAPMLGYLHHLLPIHLPTSLPPLPSFWHALATLFTLSQALGFASNSYTIWEDRQLLFFLATFALAALVASQRQRALPDRALGTYHALLFALCARLAAASRLCRDEQLPRCRSTYYASATSSTAAPWQLLVPLAVALALPPVLRGFYAGTRSLEGAAPGWLGVALPLGLAGVALYRALDAADDGGWLARVLSEGALKSVKVALAQALLALAFAAGPATFVWAAPCVRIDASAPLPNGAAPASSSPPPPSSTKPEAAPSSNSKIQETQQPRTTVTVLGYANAHGTHAALLYTALLLGAMLTQKPLGTGALALLAVQTFSLAEIADATALARTAPALAPVVLALAGGAAFFATGHQATLASLQWDAAFLASRGIAYPVSPLLVLLNTFAGPVLGVAGVPLVVLWKRGVRERGLLGEVARGVGVMVGYYAVLGLATACWAGWLRRHLMLYRVFSPRFMMGAAVLVVVDVVGVLVGVGSVRWTAGSVAEVFGWG